MPAKKRSFHGNGVTPVTFTPLTTAHLPLLHQWLNLPHVNQWYGGKLFTQEEVQAKYLPRITGKDPVQGYIIHLAEAPIAYLQYYPLTAHIPTGWSTDTLLPSGVTRAQAVGLDLFIGPTQYLEQGLGTQIVNTFLHNYLPASCQMVVADPHSKHIAARRCFEKCGFRPLPQATDPTTAPTHVLVGWQKEEETVQ